MNEFHVRIEFPRSGVTHWLAPVEFEDTDIAEIATAWTQVQRTLAALRSETVFRMLDDTTPDLCGLWAAVHVERPIRHPGPWSGVPLLGDEKDDSPTIVDNAPQGVLFDGVG